MPYLKEAPRTKVCNLCRMKVFFRRFRTAGGNIIHIIMCPNCGT